MAWNESGGSPKNPWGKRPAKEGDDAFQNFHRKLEQILRGGGGGAGSTGGEEPAGDSRQQLLIVFGVAAPFWAWQSFFTIDQAERGIIQRFGKLVSVREPGLGFHLWPMDRLTKVNTQKVSSVNYTAKVLTEDINLIDMSLGVQYQLRDPVKYLFCLEIRAMEALGLHPRPNAHYSKFEVVSWYDLKQGADAFMKP